MKQIHRPRQEVKSVRKTLPIHHSTIKEYAPVEREKLPLTERGLLYVSE